MARGMSTHLVLILGAVRLASCTTTPTTTTTTLPMPTMPDFGDLLEPLRDIQPTYRTTTTRSYGFQRSGSWCRRPPRGTSFPEWSRTCYLYLDDRWTRFLYEEQIPDGVWGYQEWIEDYWYTMNR